MTTNQPKKKIRTDDNNYKGTLFSETDIIVEDVVNLIAGAPGCATLREIARLIKMATTKRLTEEAEADGDLMQYGNSKGDPKYRMELAKFLTKQYGSPVDRDDIISTAGATHGLHTLGSLLFQPGDVVFVEDPTYFLAQVILGKDLKFQVVAVPMDDKGMDTVVLERLMAEYKDKGKTQVTTRTPFRSLIYLIPCFHNPTTCNLAPERCQKVIELARKYDSVVVCDDVYNVISWKTKSDGSFDDPPQRLFAYDKKTDPDYKGHVVSNGSFSKFMGPGLRLGWWEAPSRLRNIIADSGYLRSGGGFNQFTGGIMGTALELGLVDKHLYDMRKSFQDTVGAVCKVLRDKMPDRVKFVEPQGGYFIWLELPDSIDVPKLRQKCIDTYNVAFLLGESCSPKGNFKNCIRIAFSYYSKEEIITAVGKIAEVMTKMLEE